MERGPVECRLRTAVGEAFCMTLECEKLHTRAVIVPEASWQSGLAALQAGHPGSLCPICGNSERVIGRSSAILYDTEDGQLHPGDLYWVAFAHEGGRCSEALGGWENCNGRHLHAVLPNGNHWNIDSRAGNFKRPADRTHRCWVRHGQPPQITVDKEGDTCEAGGGSVKSGDYHGYLKDGRFLAVSEEEERARHAHRADPAPH